MVLRRLLGQFPERCQETVNILWLIQLDGLRDDMQWNIIEAEPSVREKCRESPAKLRWVTFGTHVDHGSGLRPTSAMERKPERLAQQQMDGEE